MSRSTHFATWHTPAPESLPSTHLRSHPTREGAYLVATYGGDEHGHGGPDDGAILAACERATRASLRWARGSTWDVTSEAVEGEVVRTCEVTP